MECGTFTGDGLTKYIQTDAKWIRDAKVGRKERQVWDLKWIKKKKRSKSIKPKINWNLTSATIHVWSKFRNTDFNWGWPIARTTLSELSLSSFSCCFQYHLIFDCDISIVYSIHVLVFLYLGGQLDKLCFSVRPPSRNELYTDCKLYHVLLLGK